jgi:transcriptional regulator with XRE-family HTH domain
VIVAKVAARAYAARRLAVDERMKIDSALVKKLREDRAWSQEHLATVSGVSLRTIQRVEAEGSGSLDTRMALAAAFNVSAASLAPGTGEPKPNSSGDSIRKDRRRNILLGNSIAWAVAIILTAVVDGPPVLALVLLPTLAVTSLIAACRIGGHSDCKAFTPPTSPAP